MAPTATTARSTPPRRALAHIGRSSTEVLRDVRYLATVTVGLLVVSLRRTSWPRTVREVLARQILFTGVYGVPFTGFVAVVVGLTVVLQTHVWLSSVGQSDLLGPLLVTILVRELAPLLVNVIVIVRNGSAIATELGSMSVANEVRLLDAQGIAPLVYIVLPRVYGLAISVTCLTVYFLILSFATGYMGASLLDMTSQSLWYSAADIVEPLRVVDFVSVGAKTVLPPLVTGVICCTSGLNAGDSHTEVPKATTRAISRSLVAVVVLSAAVSFVSYL